MTPKIDIIAILTYDNNVFDSDRELFAAGRIRTLQVLFPLVCRREAFRFRSLPTTPPAAYFFVLP